MSRPFSIPNLEAMVKEMEESPSHITVAAALPVTRHAIAGLKGLAAWARAELEEGDELPIVGVLTRALLITLSYSVRAGDNDAALDHIHYVPDWERGRIDAQAGLLLGSIANELYIALEHPTVMDLVEAVQWMHWYAMFEFVAIPLGDVMEDLAAKVIVATLRGESPSLLDYHLGSLAVDPGECW